MYSRLFFFLKRRQFRRFSANEDEPIYRKQIACMPHMLADAWHEAQQVARGMSETSPSHSQKSKLIPSVVQKHYEDVPLNLTAGQTWSRPPAKSHVSHFSGGVTRRWTCGEESERWKGERWTSGRGTRGTKGATCASVNTLFRGFSLNWWNCKQLCEPRRRWTAGGEKKKKRKRKRATSSVNAAAPPEPFSHFFHQDTPTLKTETLFIRGT